MSREFDGRVALVTGGSRGIGRACCECLARDGADVAINYVSNREAAQETARLVEAAGRRARLVRADVASSEQVDAMVEEVIEQLGPIDLLVNNAGVFDWVSHEETTLEIWRRTLDVNLTGTYLVTWAVKDGMVQRRWGRIVNLSSTSGLRARPLAIPYSTTKAGLIGFTKSLAEALARDNIRVNAAAPGLIETEIIDDVPQDVLDRIAELSPIPRIGQPGEVAELVLFLLSDRSSFMTGQTVVTSGGRVMLP